MVTTSPSMDILISSNLERLLCLLTNQETCKKRMEELKTTGKYTLDVKAKDIVGQWADEAKTAAAIRTMFEENGYVLDTHTAVAYASYETYKKETGDATPTLIVSTASPYKFTKDVMTAIDEKYAQEDFFVLMDKMAALSGVAIPAPIRGIQDRPVRHKTVIEKDNIKAFVADYLTK